MLLHDRVVHDIWIHPLACSLHSALTVIFNPITEPSTADPRCLFFLEGNLAIAKQTAATVLEVASLQRGNNRNGPRAATKKKTAAVCGRLVIYLVRCKNAGEILHVKGHFAFAAAAAAADSKNCLADEHDTDENTTWGIADGTSDKQEQGKERVGGYSKVFEERGVGNRWYLY